MFVTGKDPALTGQKYAQMTGFSRHLTGKIQVQSLWEAKRGRNASGVQGPRGTGHLFVTGKDPVLTGKYTQMTGFSRHLTGKFQDWTCVFDREDDDRKTTPT